MLLAKTVAQAERAWFERAKSRLTGRSEWESEAELERVPLAGRDDSVFLWQHIRALRFKTRRRKDERFLNLL